MWSAYLRCLSLYPIRTNVITSMIVTGIGDGISQRIEYKYHNISNNNINIEPFKLNPSRCFRTSLWGLLIGFPAYRWFKLLDSKIILSGPQIKTVAAKLLINQTIYAPSFNILFFGYIIYIDRLVEDKQYNNGFLSVWNSKIKNDFWPTTNRALVYWSSVNAINFYFIPGQYRVLIQSSMGVFWTAYLSLVGRDFHRINKQQNIINNDINIVTASL